MASPPSFKKVTTIPIDKHESDLPFDFFGQNSPFGLTNRDRFKAPQAGIVQLRVLINRICPFRKSPKTETALVFNEKTIESFPESIKDSFEAIPGGDGVTLARRYVYRHNFLFDRNGTEVRSILPVEDPRYKAHMSFREVPSVYKEGTDPQACGNFPSFSYSAEKCASMSDYPFDNDEKNDGIAPPETVQSIFQENSQTCARRGIHWKLDKKLPLFHGQDFFIHFYRKTEPGARDTKIAKGQNKEKFANKSYWSIDAAEEGVSLPADFLGKDDHGKTFIYPVNFGVANYEWKETSSNPPQYALKKESSDSYLLTNQAYIIIEIGGGAMTLENIHGQNYDHHYFLIITDRAVPRLVVKRSGISFSLGTYDNITGKKCFDATSFRVTFQNYLGKFLIRFEIDGENLPPWIVDRLDWVIEDGASVERNKLAVVPGGGLSVWGGNLKTSFIYGPLQYANNTALLLPPNTRGGGGAKLDIAGASFDLVAQSDHGRDLRFALPNDGKHRFTFSTTDEPVEGVLSLRGQPRLRKEPLYTCDAQFFEEVDEIGLSKPVFRNGTFYRGSHYKQFFTEFRPLNATNPDAENNLFTPAASSRLNSSRLHKSLLSVKKITHGDDLGRRMTRFACLITLAAGDHNFYRFEDYLSVHVFKRPYEKGVYSDIWLLESCKTPILTGLRMLSDDLEEKKRWKPKGVDVTDHVMRYSDSWVAQDFNRIDHTGQISFLLNKGAPFENNQTEFLKTLVDKNFYIEVWAGYKDCNYSKLNGLFKMFTGICHGGSVEFSAGRRVISCQIKDYMTVLEGQRIFNSAYYDGVIDLFAIKELLTIAGFRGAGPGEHEERPAQLVQDLLVKTANGGTNFYRNPDGRISYAWPYALPSGYARLQQPLFKFSDSSTFAEAIKQITVRAAKVFYFDQFGIAHYENYLDSVINNLLLNTTSNEPLPIPTAESTKTISIKEARQKTADARNLDRIRRLQARPLFWFTSHPSKYIGQQIFNKYSINVNVADVYNHIKTVSNTPNFNLLLGDDLEWDSIDDPKSEGFIGYLRTFYQEEGAFGSEATRDNIMQLYRTMFRPPFLAKFETYGQPVRALDLIVLNNHPYRVMKVDSTIEPEKNLWWQTFEAEWFHQVSTRDDS